jgi:hypothetical protein
MFFCGTEQRYFDIQTFVALKCCPQWADEQPAHHSIDVTKTQCQSEIPPVGVCNGKANPVKAWTGLWVLWGWRSHMYGQSVPEDGKAVSSTHRPPLSPRKYSWYSFLLQAESTPRPKCSRMDYVNQKYQWNHLESNPRHRSVYEQMLKVMYCIQTHIPINVNIWPNAYCNTIVLAWSMMR